MAEPTDALNAAAEKQAHPLQAEWDLALITGWQREGNLFRTMCEFADQHCGGVRPVRADGLKRWPYDHHYYDRPIRPWVAESMKSISDKLFSLGYYKADAAISERFMASLTASRLDCAEKLTGRSYASEGQKAKSYGERAMAAASVGKGIRNKTAATHARSAWNVCKGPCKR